MSYIIVGLIVLVLGIIFMVLGDKNDVVHPIIIGFLCIAIGIVVVSYGINELAIKEAEKCETWYLDGEEIDKDKYDLHLYSFTYDKEKGVVYFTKRRK